MVCFTPKFPLTGCELSRILRSLAKLPKSFISSQHHIHTHHTQNREKSPKYLCHAPLMTRRVTTTSLLKPRGSAVRVRLSRAFTTALSIQMKRLLHWKRHVSPPLHHCPMPSHERNCQQKKWCQCLPHRNPAQVPATAARLEFEDAPADAAPVVTNNNNNDDENGNAEEEAHPQAPSSAYTEDERRRDIEVEEYKDPISIEFATNDPVEFNGQLYE